MSGEKKEADLLREIVKAVVQKPEAVVVEHTVDKQGVKLEVSVDPSDMGKVIGAKGKTAESIRNILRAHGGQNDARVSVVINEPSDSSNKSEKE